MSREEPEGKSLIKPTLMASEEIGTDILDVFKQLYGLHMGQTTHISDILRPPNERKQQLDAKAYADYTFHPKTTSRSAKLAQDRYKKDKVANKELIQQLNKQREDVVNPKLHSSTYRKNYQATQDLLNSCAISLPIRHL